MYIIIFITASGKKEAKAIAGSLLKSRLTACVNIIEGMESLFWWKGKIDSSREALLIVKTKKEKLARIIKLVKDTHTYDLPEIIALPIISGEPEYLRWIDDSLR